MLEKNLSYCTNYSFTSCLTINDILDHSCQQKLSFAGVVDDNTYSHLPFINLAKKRKIKPVIGTRFRFNNNDFIIYALNNKGLAKLNQLYSFIFGSKNEHLELLEIFKKVNINWNKTDNVIIIKAISTSDQTFYNDLTNKMNCFFDKEFASKTTIQILPENIVTWNTFNQTNNSQHLVNKTLDLINSKKTIDFENFFNANSKEQKPQQQQGNNEKLLNLLKKSDFDFSNSTFKIPDIDNSGKKLVSICNNNLKKLELSAKQLKQYQTRLDHEIEVIKKCNFVSYFLIVADYVNYAHTQKIITGLGRGSASSSLVAFLLKITSVDPIKHGLLFERFLNVDQKVLPDIDVDFANDKLNLVYDYLQAEYGNNNFAFITSFSKYTFKTACKLFTAVFEFKSIDKKNFIYNINQLLLALDKTKSHVKNKDYWSNINIIEFLKTYPQIATQFKTIITGLMNCYSHETIHASGVIISHNNEITNHVSTRIKDNYLVANADMNTLENYHFIKFDILSLEYLSFIGEVIDKINDYKWPFTSNYSDPKTFQLLNQKLLHNIFQLDSMGMKSCINSVKPNSLDDLAVAISLYRPAAKKQIAVFAKNKQQQLTNLYDNQVIDSILNETYGCIVFQEQVMLILHLFLGIDLAETNAIIKSISKKDQSVESKITASFEKAAAINNLSAANSKKLITNLTEFCSYGFNKSHAISYAMLTYQIAYLKANYYPEFYLTLLNKNKILTAVNSEINSPFFKATITFDCKNSQWETTFSNNKFLIGYSKYLPNEKCMHVIKNCLQKFPIDWETNLRYFLKLKNDLLLHNFNNAKDIIIYCIKNQLFLSDSITNNQLDNLYFNCNFAHKDLEFSYNNPTLKANLISDFKNLNLKAKKKTAVKSLIEKLNEN